MPYWTSPLFYVTITTGIVFVLVGWFLSKFPPKAINTVYGYRTPRSMKSQGNWDLAQIYSAQQLIKFGVVLILIACMSLLFKADKYIEQYGGLGLTVIFGGIIIFRTEKKLREKL